MLAELKFDVILIMADVYRMEMNLQILVDLIMSVDGRIGGMYQRASNQ